MAKIAIVGTGTKLAKLVEPLLLLKGQDLVLVAHEGKDIANDIRDNEHVSIVEGSVKDRETLQEAFKGVDEVWANLGGADIKELAQNVVEAMDGDGVKRLVWTSTLAVYSKAPDEIGVWNDKDLGKILVDHHTAAKVVEESDLDYTVVHPIWDDGEQAVEYVYNQEGADPVKGGPEVPMPTLADTIADILVNPDKRVKEIVSIND